MIVEYIRYEIEDHVTFLSAYGEARVALDRTPSCLAYELARCTEDPRSFILRIEWDSLEGHLKGFRGGPEFAAFFAAVGPFVAAIREMRHYERTDIVRRKEVL
jgi:quinol monooxygenase YgiN